jgi:hypothetical protein
MNFYKTQRLWNSAIVTSPGGADDNMCEIKVFLQSYNELG